MDKIVLVVEDDPLNLKLLRDIITAWGYKVIEAKNGKDAIILAKEEMPDVILMDIQMPIMDGLEATKIIKKDPSTKDIPVLALTACAMEGDRETIMNSGFNGYISKPFEISELKEKICSYLD